MFFSRWSLSEISEMIRQGGVYIRLRIVVVVILKICTPLLQFILGNCLSLFVCFPDDSRASSFEDAEAPGETQGV